MQVGDLVKLRHDPNFVARLGLVLDTTRVQANVHWFTSPSGDTFSSWIYIDVLEAIA